MNTKQTEDLLDIPKWLRRPLPKGKSVIEVIRERAGKPMEQRVEFVMPRGPSTRSIREAEALVDGSRRALGWSDLEWAGLTATDRTKIVARSFSPAQWRDEVPVKAVLDKQEKERAWSAKAGKRTANVKVSVAKRPGVIDTLRAMMQRDGGATIKEMHEKLVASYPERDAKGMLATIRTQVNRQKATKTGEKYKL